MAVRKGGAAEGRTHESPPVLGALPTFLASARPSALLSPGLLGVILTLATAAIAITDVLLPRGYNIANLYVIVVLVSGALQRPAVVTFTAMTTIALTTLAYFLKTYDTVASPTGLPPGAPIFTRVVTCSGIAMAALTVWVIMNQARTARELGSQLRWTEREAQAQRNMLALASEITPIGTWVVHADDAIEWSDTAAAIFGLDPGTQPTEEILRGTLGGDEPNRLGALIEHARLTGEPFREEIRAVLPGGEERWLVVLGELNQSSNDEAFALHGTVQDITRWRTAEHSASALSHRLEQFAAILPVIIWTADPKGRIEYFNETLTRYAGQAEGQLLGDEWVEAVDPRDLERVKAAWSRCVRTGETYDIEYRVRSREGTFEWHHLTAEPERDVAGKIVRWWGSSMNVNSTRLLRDEAAALTAERATILETIGEGVYTLDVDWRFRYLNPAAEGLLSRAAEDLVGKVVWDEYPEVVGTEVDDIYHQAMESRAPAQFSNYNPVLDMWFDITVSPSATGLTVFFRDTSQLRKLSDQLAQSQRLESVGQLTGGIAHDFNNLLTVVLGGADALLADHDLGPDARETAGLIATAAERGAELTHRLLAFSRRQPLQPRAVDLTDRVVGLAPLLRRTLGEDIDVWVTGEPTLPADVDPGQFDNALLNLAINARDAMPNGGKLTVEVAPATLDEAYAAAHAEVEAGEYVRVTVTDSGVGIDDEHRATLFDPFFTTKEAGKGSGLGLAMVWGFVKQSGGHVTVYSERGVGSSFAMYLPLATEPIVDDGHRVHTDTGERGSGLVLVAEDDDLVRRFAAEQLRAHGYDVIEAASGPDALALLDDATGLDLLFTDVIMPGGMTGRHLADAVEARVPGVPVLYASGYTENVILHNGRLDAGVKLLAKPYSGRQLLAAIAAALAGKQGSR